MKAVIALCLLAAASVSAISSNTHAHLGARADPCANAGGKCVPKSAGCANGDFVSGKCSGAPVCCVPWTTTAACKAKNGVCGGSNSCNGQLVHGVCGGSSVCCVASQAPAVPTTPATPVTPPPAVPIPVNPTPVVPVSPVPSVMPPGSPVLVPKGGNQVGFCSADGKSVGMCKSSAACGKLAGHTQHSGVCAHSMSCCVPPAGQPLSDDGEIGVDIEGAVISSNTAKCYLQTGFRFFMVRVWRTSGIVDATCAPNIRTLRAAGASQIDVYMFADFRKDVNSGIDTFMKYLKDQDVLQFVQRVWLDIERDINGAYMWSRSNLAANVAKVQSAMERVKSHGKLPGIYAPGAGGWSEMMGKGTVTDTVPMWYVSKRGYNNDASDNDWVPFANWQSNPPVNTQHQFASGDAMNFKICGTDGLDLTWRAKPITLPYNWDVARNAPF